MVLLFYATYISVDIAHHQIVRVKVGKGGIMINKLQKRAACINLKVDYTTPSVEMMDASITTNQYYNKAVLTYKNNK